MNNLAASFSKKVFLLYKLYNSFSPSDILVRIYSNCLLSLSVVLWFHVSQATGQDLVVFQVHHADLPRRFQQSLTFDNHYQA